MQATAEQRRISPRLIVFPNRMAAQTPIPSQPPEDQGRSGHNPVVHGSKAAIAAAIFAGLAMLGTLGTFYVNWSNRSDLKTKEQFARDVNPLIDAKLNPTKETIHNDLKEQLAPISGQLKDLNDKLGAIDVRVAKLEARFDQLQTDQKNFSKISLDKVYLEITRAEKSKTRLDPSEVAEVGQHVLAAASVDGSSVSALAWKVVNRTLSYYSTVLPPPETGWFTVPVENKDAECLSAQPGAHNFLLSGVVFEHCTQHLDPILGPVAVKNALLFHNVMFKDVRVIYSGGALRLAGVYFVNCTFELAPSFPSKKVGETLFASASNPVTLELP
jgi:hypothetical protein